MKSNFKYNCSKPEFEKNRIHYVISLDQPHVRKNGYKWDHETEDQLGLNWHEDELEDFSMDSFESFEMFYFSTYNDVSMLVT